MIVQLLSVELKGQSKLIDTQTDTVRERDRESVAYDDELEEVSLFGRQRSSHFFCQ
jgi:hypothetical protein